MINDDIHAKEVRVVGEDGEQLGIMSVDAAKDAAFYSFEGADEVTYKAGECVVLYPVEAHLPCRAVSEPMPIKKAVIKLNYHKLRRI